MTVRLFSTLDALIVARNGRYVRMSTRAKTDRPRRVVISTIERDPRSTWRFFTFGSHSQSGRPISFSSFHALFTDESKRRKIVLHDAKRSVSHLIRRMWRASLCKSTRPRFVSPRNNSSPRWGRLFVTLQIERWAVANFSTLHLGVSWFIELSNFGDKRSNGAPILLPVERSVMDNYARRCDGSRERIEDQHRERAKTMMVLSTKTTSHFLRTIRRLISVSERFTLLPRERGWNFLRRCSCNSGEGVDTLWNSPEQFPLPRFDVPTSRLRNGQLIHLYYPLRAFSCLLVFLWREEGTQTRLRSSLSLSLFLFLFLSRASERWQLAQLLTYISERMTRVFSSRDAAPVTQP